MARLLSVAVLCVLCASVARGYLDESALNDELRELIATLHKTCTEKTGISNDAVLKTNDGEFPNDDKLKCYMKCILSESGAMDEAGLIDYMAVDGIIPDKLKAGIKNMFEACIIKAQDSDLCERAFTFYKCSYEVDAKNYFLI
ncbi:Odorant-binding protein 83a [Carabus blaptoides fortunei]